MYLLTPAIPGDANLDGKVDINDLTIVLAHYNQAGMSWAPGDFTGGGTVDINDLTIVLAHYNQGGGLPPPAWLPCPNRPAPPAGLLRIGPAAVPRPASSRLAADIRVVSRSRPPGGTGTATGPQPPSPARQAGPTKAG